MTVDLVTVTPDPAEFASYEDCLVSEWGDACADWVKYQPVPGEVMKRDGFVQSIAPLEVEQLATFSVLEQDACIHHIEGFLGLSAPRPVSQRYVVAEYVGSYSSGYSWTTSSPLEGHRESLMYLDWQWDYVQDGHCGGTTAHEMTHLIMGDVPLPSYLNEGLATWMEVQDRSNASEENASVDCGEDAWYGWDWDLQADAWVPYTNLLAPDPDLPGIYHYYSGMCFWDYLESTYGIETVLDIVQTTWSYRDDRFNGCTPFVESTYFIRDIVNPMVGEDVSPITMERWGFGELFTGCEGLY